MKKLLIVLSAFFILGCATSGPASAKNVSLDEAIQIAGKDINDTLNAGTKVAVLSFGSPSDQFSDYVIEELSIYLVRNKKLVVVDRREIDLIRNEVNFQMSGEVSEESAQAIGSMLGAQSIVSGSLMNLGSAYRLRTKAINVQSAAIETSSSVTVNDDEQMQFLLAGASTRTAPGAAPQAGAAQAPGAAAAQQPTAAAAPPAPVYKVGDTGPAGGIVFYDKGRVTEGWRYLEVAPVETEFESVYSAGPVDTTDRTLTTIGSGKKNTQLVVEALGKKAGEWDRPAQNCNDLELNGFNDWFLPSADELNQMYGNLKRRELGDFKDAGYWSSTITWTGPYSNFVHSQDFKTGSTSQPENSSKLYVRAIRAF
jgi:TolB-like protein